MVRQQVSNHLYTHSKSTYIFIIVTLRFALQGLVSELALVDVMKDKV